MAEDQSEEFRKFILENREIIEKILNEGKDDSNPKEKIKEEIDDRIDDTKGKVKDVSDAVLKIVSDDDVQKHLITGCLEFLHFFEAVLNAIPLSPEARETVNKFEDARDSTIKNVVAVGAKDKMENIIINDVDPKTSSTSKKKEKKMENITINEVKDPAKSKKKTE